MMRFLNSLITVNSLELYFSGMNEIGLRHSAQLSFVDPYAMKKKNTCFFMGCEMEMVEWNIWLQFVFDVILMPLLPAL